LSHFLEAWLQRDRQRVRPSTWRQREQYARCYLVPALGNVAVDKLAPADIERMTGSLIASGRSARTAAHARVILRRALADAVRDGIAHRNAAALARAPHVPSRALTAGRDYLGTDDLRRLVAVAETHPLGALVTVAATTGVRQGELLGLGWSDVDLKGRTLRVRRALARSWDGFKLAEPKTARSRRTIYLPDTAIAALTRRRQMQDDARAAAGAAWQDVDDLVFTDAIGRPLRNDAVNHAWHRFLDDGGFPSIPFHGLRHTAATALLTAGTPLKVVSDVLGHSGIGITADTYGGTVAELQQEAAGAMDRLLATPSS
jgi:integrase